MRVVVVGPDRGLGGAFEDLGVEVARVEGVAVLDRLEEAGIEDAAVLVLTDVEEASTVPGARSVNPDLRVVVYDGRTLPEFVRPTVDLAIDPELMDPDVVAEELANG
ncbi:CTP synthetase [Halobacteriales archaeon QS_8_69_26]|nr:MAG: CTP synthetase [Halobacteriales archaeon QS_8_69_26]